MNAWIHIPHTQHQVEKKVPVHRVGASSLFEMSMHKAAQALPQDLVPSLDPLDYHLPCQVDNPDSECQLNWPSSALVFSPLHLINTTPFLRSFLVHASIRSTPHVLRCFADASTCGGVPVPANKIKRSHLSGNGVLGLLGVDRGR